METIKIYDANLRELGIMERKKAHMSAQWHITFHCWIVHKYKKAILFQLRSKEKQNFPDMFDVSAAGHLMAGEEIADGIREVSEELGISIPSEDFYPLGYRVEVDDSENGQKNREYQAVYIATTEKNLAEFKPQVEEVTGLMWLDISNALNLFSGKVDSVLVQGIIYNKDTGTWEEKERKVSIKSFVPRIQNYYLTATIMAERTIDGNFPLSIS
jgi:isopentenyldiphosphate isomerase